MPIHHHIASTSDAFTVSTTLRPLRHLPDEHIDIGGGLHATPSDLAGAGFTLLTIPVISSPGFEVLDDSGSLMTEIATRALGGLRDDWEERVADARFSTDDLGAYEMTTINTPLGLLVHTWTPGRAEQADQHTLYFFEAAAA